MGEYFEFNGHYYAIDMDKFMEFISEIKSNEKDNSTTITQVFADNDYIADDDDNVVVRKPEAISSFKAISKEITENKNNMNPIFSNIRYDFIKILLSTLVSPFYNQDGSFVIAENEDDLFLGQKLAFNTLLNKGIIFEIS